MFFIIYVCLVYLYNFIPRALKYTFRSFFISHKGNTIGESKNENSVLSFIHVVKHTPCIETDCRLTKDGRIVLFHDPAIYGKRIRDLDLNDTGCDTLDELIDHPFFEKVTYVNLDIKDDSFELADSVMELLEQKNVVDKFLIGGFHPRIIRYVRRKSNVKTPLTLIEMINVFVGFMSGFLFPVVIKGDIMGIPFLNSPYPVKDVCEDRLQCFLLYYIVLTRPFMWYMKHRGIPVACWTVNTQEDVDACRKLGVSAVFTDRVAELKND